MYSAQLKSRARLAGVLYFPYLLTSVLGEVLLKQAGASAILGLPSDGAAIATAMSANPDAFHAGFALSLVSLAVYIALMGLFYQILAPADGTVARIALLVSIVALATQALGGVLELVAFGLATTNRVLVPEDEVGNVILLLLRGYAQAYTVGLILWSMFWLLVASLVYRSGFFPRLLTVAPALAGLATLTLLWPPLSRGLPVVPLAGVGELVFASWLLVRGVDEARWLMATSAGDAERRTPQP